MAKKTINQALKDLFLGLGGDSSALEDNSSVSDYIADLESAIKACASGSSEDLIDDTEASENKTYSSSKIESIIPEDELPPVTSEDNGKVLMVVNGEWALGLVTRTYTVSYNLNRGSGTTPNDQEVEAGGSITVASAPIDITPPTGFISFLGWDTNPNQGYPARVPAGSTYTPEGDTVLYAIYEQEI